MGRSSPDRRTAAGAPRNTRLAETNLPHHERTSPGQTSVSGTEIRTEMCGCQGDGAGKDDTSVARTSSRSARNRLRPCDARHHRWLPVLITRPQRVHAGDYCPAFPIPGPREISDGVEFGGGIFAPPRMSDIPLMFDKEFACGDDSRLHLFVLSMDGPVMLGQARCAVLPP